MNYAIILSGGIGTRMQMGDFPKQYLEVEKKPILLYTLEQFQKSSAVEKIVIVAADAWREKIRGWMEEDGITKFLAFADAGDTRQESIHNGLTVCMEDSVSENDGVIIHDGVRPFVEERSIDGCIDSLDQFNAATVAYASTDTILLTEDLGDRKVVKSVPERPNTFRAQTPQAFRFGTIVKAYELAAADPDFHPTDDTRVVVDYLPDEPVAIVDGSETNLKITTPSDMPIAEGIARSLDPEHAKEEATARMHAVFAEAFSQMHSR